MLSAREAARALAAGFARAGVACDEAPLADGGEGTLDALESAFGGERLAAQVSDPLGRPRSAEFLLLEDGRALVEAAEVIGLPLLAPEERDPLRASSRGLGELVRAALAAGGRRLVVGLGGTATVDGGAGLRQVIDELPVPATALCDVSSPLVDAARIFARQKGASPDDVVALERRLLQMEELRPFAGVPGAGAAGGLGAAFAALGAELVPGADYVVDAVGLRMRLRGAALAVTGEGVLDRTSTLGKVTAAVVRLCAAEGMRCAVFAGRVDYALPDAETYPLSGDPARSSADLEALGEKLGLLL